MQRAVYYSLDYAKTSLSTRALNRIKSLGVTDLRELADLSKTDLRRKWGIGEKTLEEIIRFCNFLGIILKGEEAQRLCHYDFKQGIGGNVDLEEENVEKDKQNSSSRKPEENVQFIDQLSKHSEILDNVDHGLEQIYKNYGESDQKNRLDSIKQARSHIQSTVKIMNDLISGKFS